MKSLRALLCLFLVASCSFYVFAQEDDDSVEQAATNQDFEVQVEDALAEEAAPVLGPSPYARTVVYFPSSPERKFIVADPEPVDVLIGFTNEGEKTFNVTWIQAALMYPPDHRYYIQNYTRFIYEQAVEPKEQTTLLYKFLPDQGLDAREFDLTIFMFYGDETGTNYSTVVFNDTISLVDRPDSVDAQTFFTYVGILAAVGLASFVAYKNFFSASSKKTRTRRVETGTKDVPASENEWLAGTSATANVRPARAASPRKSKSAK